MAHLSDFLENRLLDHVFRDRQWTKPAAIYVALFTSSPSDAGGGTEVSGGSYARVQHGTWEATQGGTPAAASNGTSGATQNSGTVVFPVPTANWGVVTHIGIFDAASGGNLLFHGPLAAPKTINNGDPAPSFAPGALDITVG
jgi:hypothetical protein